MTRTFIIPAHSSPPFSTDTLSKRVVNKKSPPPLVQGKVGPRYGILREIELHTEMLNRTEKMHK